MKFPCPHCGSHESLYDRSADEIKPIIPLDLQGNFDEPPPLISASVSYNFHDVRPVSHPIESQIITNSGLSLQEQIQPRNTVGYKFESPSYSTVPRNISTRGTIEFTTNSRLENLEGTIKTLENEIKILSSDMKNILKSQKVTESILINMNKKLLKLQKE
jgi:hypothetical protein